VYQPSRRPHPHPWRTFFVVAIAIFLTSVDLFVINVALPAIRLAYVDATLSSLSWILTTYAIVFAALLVPAGKLGDLYGRRRVFVVGLVLFLVGSAVGAAAPSLPVLLAARAIQAMGAAAITPTSLGLALPLFPPDRRGVIVGAWGAIASLGAATGPVLGAILRGVELALGLHREPAGRRPGILVATADGAEVPRSGARSYPTARCGHALR
jgi:MFS family permease